MPAFAAGLRFRRSEWILLGFFVYVAILVPFFPDRGNLGYQPLIIASGAFGVFWCFSFAERHNLIAKVSEIRDWIPLGLILVAFREMELFLPRQYNTRYEAYWIHWDQIVLQQWNLRGMIESFGPILPFYLELCYLLVYGVGAYCVLVFWFKAGRKTIDRFYMIYLSGTLLAYSLFPYFPSRPPRVAFPQVAPPNISSWLRELNLGVLNSASIHSGVFPSAHVSSAFAAAWAMFLLLPGRKHFGWGMLIYAISVSIATVYGRYHYAADVAAGFVVSLVPAAVALAIRFQHFGRDAWAAAREKLGTVHPRE
ncbi:MAG: phosphatase PAP2 family protein [Acidobacteriaceae bacterium]|nr:phosphatase PAP2 family protein [Acidobacteriaceae bacterium]